MLESKMIKIYNETSFEVKKDPKDQKTNTREQKSFVYKKQ